MHRINLKFLGILFIAICCLAPVCAVEMNQANDIETLDSNYGMPFPLSVEANDVKQGEMVIIDLWTDDFVSAGADVWLYGPCSTELEFVWIDHGHGQLCLDSSQLPLGTYTVRAKSQMYGPGTFEEATTTFTVSR